MQWIPFSCYSKDPSQAPEQQPPTDRESNPPIGDSCETVLQLEATIKHRCISKTHQPRAAERLHALLAGCPAETLSWIEQLRVVRVIKQTRKRCKRSSAWILVSHATGACQNSLFERVRSCPVHASRLMQHAGTQQLSGRHW